jgi:hypothetical protein
MFFLVCGIFLLMHSQIGLGWRHEFDRPHTEAFTRHQIATPTLKCRSLPLSLLSLPSTIGSMFSDHDLLRPCMIMYTKTRSLFLKTEVRTLSSCYGMLMLFSVGLLACELGSLGAWKPWNLIAFKFILDL